MADASVAYQALMRIIAVLTHSRNATLELEARGIASPLYPHSLACTAALQEATAVAVFLQCILQSPPASPPGSPSAPASPQSPQISPEQQQQRGRRAFGADVEDVPPEERIVRKATLKARDERIAVLEAENKKLREEHQSKRAKIVQIVETAAGVGDEENKGKPGVMLELFGEEDQTSSPPGGRRDDRVPRKSVSTTDGMTCIVAIVDGYYVIEEDGTQAYHPLKGVQSCYALLPLMLFGGSDSEENLRPRIKPSPTWSST
eukprot:tig00021294_g20035.t1